MSQGTSLREGLALAGLWLALWGLGFPAAHVDDLVYTGPAFQLVQTGHLANPLLTCVLEMFQTDRAYILPPLYPHLMGLWLHVFGISEGSVRAFPMFAGFVASFLVFGFIRRAGGGAWHGAIGVGVLLPAFLGCGLRPEVLAFALLAAGQWALLERGRGCHAAGFALGAASVACHPIMVGLVAPLCAWQVLRHLEGAGANRKAEARALFLCGVAGIGAVALACVAAVEGEVREFARVYLLNVEATTPVGRQLQGIREAFVFGYELPLKGPGYALILAAGILGLGPWGRRDRVVRGTAISLAVFAVAGTLLFVVRTAAYLFFVGMLAVVFMSARARSGLVRRCLAISCAVLLFWGALPWCLGAVAFAVADRPPAALRDAARDLRAKRFLVDDVAARYVYGYRLPPNARDWWFESMGWVKRGEKPRVEPPSDVKVANMTMDEAWVVGAIKLEMCSPDSGVNVRHLEVFGHRFGTVVLNVRDVAIVRPSKAP